MREGLLASLGTPRLESSLTGWAQCNPGAWRGNCEYLISIPRPRPLYSWPKPLLWVGSTLSTLHSLGNWEEKLLIKPNAGSPLATPTL